MTSITSIKALPTGPFEGTGIIGIVITSNVPSYFKIEGSGLDNIEKITWYPAAPSSVEFISRELILVNSTSGTFMIKVTDNFLSNADRGGNISIRLKSGDTHTFPVRTYGPVSYQALWTNPQSGLNTG